MSKTPHRTTPLDRDGDGLPGGSLPGNATAPLLTDDAPPVDDLADARTAPGDGEDKQDAMNRETDQANAEATAEEDPDATFTAEEIAAGQTPVVEQEGETETTAAATSAQLDEADRLAVIETSTAPIAVRVRELKVLTEARRLYKSEHGYSAAHGAPYIEDATVEAWIAGGLAERIPSAGNHGGVRATPEARRHLGILRREPEAA